MPFLADIVGRETSQIQNTVTGTVNSAKNAASILQNSVTNQVVGAANSVVTNTVKAATGAAVSAITNLATGNVAGAVSSLSPSNLASQALSGVLGFSSSSSTTEPGYSSTFSSSGGVNPGDALNGALARPDPMLTYLWYCQLPVVGAPAGASGTGVNSASSALNSLVSNLLGTSVLSGSMGGSQTGSSSSQLPWYYVEECSAPLRTFQELSIFRDGRKRHYPTQYSVNNLRLSFYADVDNTSMQYLMAWENAKLRPYTAATLNTAGGFGRASGYKLPIYVYMIDPTKQTLITLEYTECWPLGLDDVALTSQSGNERIIFHVNFSVGDVFVNLSNIPGSLTSLLVNNALTNTVVSGINNGLSAAANSALSLL